MADEVKVQIRVPRGVYDELERYGQRVGWPLRTVVLTALTQFADANVGRSITERLLDPGLLPTRVLEEVSDDDLRLLGVALYEPLDPSQAFRPAALPNGWYKLSDPLDPHQETAQVIDSFRRLRMVLKANRLGDATLRLHAEPCAECKPLMDLALTVVTGLDGEESKAVAEAYDAYFGHRDVASGEVDVERRPCQRCNATRLDPDHPNTPVLLAAYRRIEAQLSEPVAS